MNSNEESSILAAQKPLAEVVRDLLGQIKSRDQEILNKDAHIQRLSAELARLKRLKFAQTREAFKAVGQEDLFGETLDADLAEVTVQFGTTTDNTDTETKPPRNKHPGRKPLPPELPRVEHRHDPDSCSCGKCGKDMVLIREDVTELLDVVPAKFFVQRHVYPQYACRSCETIEAVPAIPALIEGGMASPGVLAWVIISKFVDHLPLYRLEQIAARSNLELSRSTMGEWVGRVGVALRALVERLREMLLQRNTLHGDETPVRQLDPGSGKTKRAYLWAYCSAQWDTGPPILVFDYQTSRHGVHAKNFLEGWKGNLAVDDYAGYKHLFTKGITELGCMAHARRKFFDLHAEQPRPVTTQALTWFGKLYDLEREWVEATVEQRTNLRRDHSLPLLTQFNAWLWEQRRNTANGSGLAKALDYTLNRWDALARYATRGDWPIDNNRIENCIRPIALGKKNWEFVGSERAGVRAAAIQSLLGTAKLNGIEPYAWLKDTLEKLPTWPNSRLDELLPLRPEISA